MKFDEHPSPSDDKKRRPLASIQPFWSVLIGSAPLRAVRSIINVVQALHLYREMGTLYLMLSSTELLSSVLTFPSTQFKLVRPESNGKLFKSSRRGNKSTPSPDWQIHVLADVLPQLLIIFSFDFNNHFHL